METAVKKTTRTVDAKGARIAWDDYGPAGAASEAAPHAPAFLLLPGWCVNRDFFAPLAERLATTHGHRVLLLDWRGHGDSETPASDFGDTELLEDALAVVAASGAASVIPVGQAHGAWIAVALRERLGAARVPALAATSWLLLEPPPPFRAVLQALQDAARWEEARDQLFAMWTNDAPPEVRERMRREMGAYGFEMWSRAARSIEREYTRHGTALNAIAGLTPPPRFLHVYSQPRAPEFLEAQQRFAREHAWFGVTRLEARSHFPPLEVPAETAAALASLAVAPAKSP